MTTIWHEIDDRHHYHKCGPRSSHLRASVCPQKDRIMIVLHFHGEVYTEKAKKLTEKIIADLDNQGLVKIQGHKILIAD